MDFAAVLTRSYSSAAFHHHRPHLLPIKLAVRHHPPSQLLLLARPNHLVPGGLRSRKIDGVGVVRAIDVRSGGGGGGGGEKGRKSKVSVVLKVGVLVLGMTLAVLVVRFREVVAEDGVRDLGVRALVWTWEMLKRCLPKMLPVLVLFKEQGLVLFVLLGLSAFFSMSETAITTLWPWKVRELAEKESEGGVFRILRSDVNRFLTTILIGTTVANIGATAIFTDAATALFGEAGITAATGVMTVAVLLLTEITPKSIGIHNATEVARIVLRPIAWLSVVLYPVGKVATILSMGIQKMLGLRARSEPYVTEDELKLMLRGAELSGAIEEEEQDMIENVLEIKDTFVREVMTPLVDVVAIDVSAKLIDFQKLWATRQYSRVPVFEQRIDNIVGIAYAMDMLEYFDQVEQLQGSTVVDITHKPIYFVPDSMSVWNLLREFRIRKVHMAVVLNEYGGTVGIVTLEDVVEEIVGEIYDENDSKEEIQRKTGHVALLQDGSFGVDANTSMDQLSEELNVKLPEGRQCETVSGFICESFGCIPNKGDKMKVILEKANRGENEYDKADYDHNNKETEKHQIFELEILEANARKVESVVFRPINDASVEVDSRGANSIVSRKIVKRRKQNDGKYDPSDVDVDGPLSVERAEISLDDDVSSHDSLQDRYNLVVTEQADDGMNSNDNS